MLHVDLLCIAMLLTEYNYRLDYCIKIEALMIGEKTGIN